MIRPLLAPALALLAAAAAAAQTPIPVVPQPVPAKAAPAKPVAAPVPPQSIDAHPALWKLADADTTIWLLGTIHALPAGVRWRDARIQAAIADSQALVIETVLDTDPNKSAALFYALALSPNLPPLLDRVRPADRPKLARMLAKSPVPAKTLDGFETWAAAMILTGASLGDLGLTAQNGVEATIQQVFAAAHKPITGLETPAQQLGFLDGLPEDEQRRFLGTVLDDPQDARTEFAAMLKAWTSGDDAAIARTFDEEAKVSPALRAVLITRRNAAWADWIAKRMAQPGHILLAVGAGHLAGAGSVQALLEVRGFTVTRVR